MKVISQIYQKNLHREDHLALGLELGLILVGVVYMILNAVTFRYPGNSYLSSVWIWVVPILLMMVMFSSHFTAKVANTAYLIKSYCLYFLAFFAFLVLLDGIQYTPFPPVDSYFAAADHVLYIDEIRVIDWTYAHPRLLKILNIAYSSVLLQLLLMPLLLYIFGKRWLFHSYLVTSLIAYIMGATVYYFFPSVGPAGILTDPNFSQAQIVRVLQFEEIHQYLSMSTFTGGMIAFPSFHVMWSVIMIYSLRNTPAWLFSPLFLLNVMAILATLCLGWDYAVDVMNGVISAGVAIIIAKRVLMSGAISQ